MELIKLPKICYKSFQPTRDSIQLYAQLISSIKGSLVPHQKNWEQFSLKVYTKGFTTTAMPIETETGFEALELNLNFVEHKLKIFYKNYRGDVDFIQNSISDFTNQLFDKLSSYGIKLEQPEDKFLSHSSINYDLNEVKKLWDLYRNTYFLLLEFKGTLLFETSNINFWSHHFDLAMLVFSGKMIEGKDPNDWDKSREQMNFGLSSGDDKIPEPYFYITSYPFKKSFFEIALPNFAVDQTDGFNAVVVKLSSVNEFDFKKSEFLNLFQRALQNNFS